jgi:hypothetical protein
MQTPTNKTDENQSNHQSHWASGHPRRRFRSHGFIRQQPGERCGAKRTVFWVYGNALTLNNPGNSFTGSGAGLTGLNASQLSSGTVPDLRLGGIYSSALTFNNAGNVFVGDGTGLTNVNANLLEGRHAAELTIPDSPFAQSAILTPVEQRIVNKMIGNPWQTWVLAYSRTRDGGTSSNLHANVNLRGPSVTVMSLTNGKKLGGYFDLSWTSAGGYRSNSTAAFLSEGRRGQTIPWFIFFLVTDLPWRRSRSQLRGMRWRFY